jgi:hypothetical protein
MYRTVLHVTAYSIHLQPPSISGGRLLHPRNLRMCHVVVTRGSLEVYYKDYCLLECDTVCLVKFNGLEDGAASIIRAKEQDQQASCVTRLHGITSQKMVLFNVW